MRPRLCLQLQRLGDSVPRFVVVVLLALIVTVPIRVNAATQRATVRKPVNLRAR